MRVLGVLVGLALLAGCGDDSAQACGQLCSVAEDCADELGMDLQGAGCFDACEAQVAQVGAACVNAIASTIECLGTCDVDSLTDAELLACQDEALSISDHCE